MQQVQIDIQDKAVEELGRILEAKMPRKARCGYT